MAIAANRSSGIEETVTIAVPIAIAIQVLCRRATNCTEELPVEDVRPSLHHHCRGVDGDHGVDRSRAEPPTIGLDRNHAILGPNNLVRAKLGPPHGAVSYGSGTWDCFDREFS